MPHLRRTDSQPRRLGESGAFLDMAARAKLMAAADDESVARVENQRAAADRSARKAKFIQQVGRRYADCTLDTFEIYDDAQKPAVEKLQAYISAMNTRIADGAGLIIYGPVGTGKDHLLSAMLRAASVDCGFEIRYTNGPDLFRAIRESIGKNQEQQLVQEFARPKILAISDPCPSGANMSDYNFQTLFSIIDARYRDLLPTWVTLNVAKKPEAEAMLSPQVFNRLLDNSASVFCKWPSYRERRRIA